MAKTLATHLAGSRCIWDNFPRVDGSERTPCKPKCSVNINLQKQPEKPHTLLLCLNATYYMPVKQNHALRAIGMAYMDSLKTYMAHKRDHKTPTAECDPCLPFLRKQNRESSTHFLFQDRAELTRTFGSDIHLSNCRRGTFRPWKSIISSGWSHDFIRNSPCR